MHDLALIDEIIEQVEASTEENQTIKTVTIQLGALAPLTQEEVEHISEHRNWRIKIEKVPAVVKCPACGYKGEPKVIAREHDIVLFECPACSQVPDIESGNEIIVKSIEVITED